VRQAITEALDKSDFAFVSRRAEPGFLARCLVVDQLGQLGPACNMPNTIVSRPNARALAIVDRTGDIKLAAKEVVASRLAFGGRSHCAVDRVFVNEFVAEEFLATVVHELSNYEKARLSNNDTFEGRKQGLSSGNTGMSSRLQDIEAAIDGGSCRVVWRGQVGMAAEVVDRYLFICL
jgi:hypothetical protein